ncbi:MAG: hypothetical protein ACRC3A_01530, partial [Culicoidibacterales bacterium]
MKQTKKISLILGIISAIVIVSSVFNVSSYFSSKSEITNPLEITDSIGDLGIKIEEDFTLPTNWDGTEYEKIVSVKNTEEIDAL